MPLPPRVTPTDKQHRTMSAQQPTGPGPLTRIPVEILLRITSFLPTSDLGRVRLTCRSLEQSLFHFFSHEFFRKKQFMVFSDSLQALIDISKHPALSAVLKHVIIATDTLSQQVTANIGMARPHSIPSLGDDTYIFNRAYLALADQNNLLDSGGLKDILAEAFRNLPNLEIVDIRDFNSSTRDRDGEGTRWTSYGSKTLGQLVSPTFNGITLVSTYDRPRLPEQIFSATVAALAAADARAQQIHINLRASQHGKPAWSLTDKAFYIPPRLEAPLEAVLGRLTTLHLALSPNDAAYTREPNRPFMLHRFLSLTPNLTWLRLNMSQDSPRTAGGDIPWETVFNWIINESTTAQDNPWTPYQTQPIRFPKLEQLDIGSVMMSERTLLRLVRKLAPSLKKLSLRRVTLLQPQNTDSDDDEATGWPRVLEKIGALGGVDIREMNLAYLQDGCRFHSRLHQWVKDNVNFVDHGGSTRRITERTFQGTSTPALVKQILLDVLPRIPKILPSEDPNGEDDSAESEDSHDDDDDEDMDMD
ncbi:hypothetical protein QBC39DRAFT_364105 [Podospora conica]|nr:hypothetical protein QBC39DRAFT_364105 [Schizothecium conicum]